MDSDQILEQKRKIGAKLIVSTSFGLMSIIGILGNTLVMLVIWKDPTLQIKNQLSNMAIFNLAVTDFLSTAFVGAPAAISALYDKYPFSHLFCRFCTYWNVVTITATMAFLAIVTIDRYLLCKGRGVYPPFVTRVTFAYAVLYAWVSSALLGIAWSLNPDLIAFDFWAGICDVKWSRNGPSNPAGFGLVIYSTIFHFIVPTSAIIGCNVGIMRIAKKVGHVKESSTVGEQRQVTEYANPDFYVPPSEIVELALVNERIRKAMTVVIVAYMCLTAPVALIRIGKALGGENGPVENLPTWITTFCTILQFSSSIVNPLIYGLFRNDFRKAYLKIWVRICSSF